MMKRTLALTILALVTSFSAGAAILAIDNAANYSSWSQSSLAPSDNGGTGFGPWVIRSTTTSDDAFNGAFLGSSGSIDTGGNALGLYANTSNRIVGYRGFAFNNFLPVQSVFRFSMDNGGVDESGASVGLSLRDNNFNLFPTDVFANERFRFSFQQGDANYTITDSTGDVDTGIGFTSNGLNLEFALTTLNTYSLTVIDANTLGTLGTFTGTLGGTTDATINSLAVFNNFAGSGGSRNVFFNNFSVDGLIVPEPTTFGLLAISSILLRFRRRIMRRV